jgi:hypothetical protein
MEKINEIVDFWTDEMATLIVGENVAVCFSEDVPIFPELLVDFISWTEVSACCHCVNGVVQRFHAIRELLDSVENEFWGE